MDMLRVPTRRVAVEIVLDGGEILEGHLFLAPSCDRTGRPEQLVDLLNDPRRFIPLRVHRPAPGGATDRLVNKSHIVRVRTDRERSDASALEELVLVGDDETEPERTRCVLSLSDGSTCAGELALDAPWTSSRLLDKLNLGDAFVPILVDGSTELVHCAHVVFAV